VENNLERFTIEAKIGEERGTVIADKGSEITIKRQKQDEKAAYKE
jgi:hypothetical protein